MSNGDTTVVVRPSASVSRVLALVFLLAVAGVVESVRLSSLHNADVWMHLRLGNWILANKTWPTTGLFSQVPEVSWNDHSWLAESLLAAGYRALGLSVVPALGMVYRLLIAGVTFFLAGGSRRNFWLPAMISAAAQYLLYPFPAVGYGTSAILFALELLVLLDFRETGNVRRLFLLPLLLVVWANLDINFVYGSGLLLVSFAVLVVEQFFTPGTTGVPKAGQGNALATVALAMGGSLLASFLSPYRHHAYSDFVAAQASPANIYTAARAAMSFHEPRHYVFLLLTMAAFLALGLRRSRDLFLLLTLVACTTVAFYAQSESWLGILASVAVLGDALRSEVGLVEEARRKRFSPGWFIIPTTISVVILLCCYAFVVPRQNEVLLARVARDYPVLACDYIRQRHLPTPIFNTYAWGGFLSWYLPEYPLAIDTRSALYPDETETSYFKVMKVLQPYQSLDSMRDARTLLFDKQSVMGQALRGVPGFQVAYEDEISMVLLHEKGEQTAQSSEP